MDAEHPYASAPNIVNLNMFVGKDMTPAIVHEVQKDSPAYISGIKKNDKIVSIDNKKVNRILEVSTFISTSTSESIEFIILRNSQELIFNIKPEKYLMVAEVFECSNI